jgi:hypothetical protein
MALVLYACNKAISSLSQPIKVGKSVIWIRVEDYPKYDVTEALDNAEPFPGEIVLNSIPRRF